MDYRVLIMRFVSSLMKVMNISRLFRQDQDQDFFFKTMIKTKTFISRPRQFFMSSRRLETKTKVSRLILCALNARMPPGPNLRREMGPIFEPPYIYRYSTIYIEVATTEVITVDCIYVFVHCVSTNSYLQCWKLARIGL